MGHAWLIVELDPVILINFCDLCADCRLAFNDQLIRWRNLKYRHHIASLVLMRHRVLPSHASARTSIQCAGTDLSSVVKYGMKGTRMGCPACHKRSLFMRGAHSFRGLSGGSSWGELARTSENATEFPQSCHPNC